MAGSVSEDNGTGRSSEGLCGQRCQSGNSLAEWRSSEQVENGTPSTSPPYWDTDDDEDCGPKPSELYGKFTWKIENFSQISKRELRSNAFEVGGYKWYILIYPQGCDVCNHLSLFLCVANHDKLLPGWSHFAQFTIAVVNKDPKKSKYSDTLHRFWKKEHDWGWKKFMELSKVLEGFIVSDTLVIKAQVQVIREKAHRPFRCLDCQYRRELVRVYLSNVELICCRFIEERRTKLGKLIEDKVRWSSFRAFWLGVDQNARRRMSRDKTDAILKVVVKHFFIEKEVTSTLVMDSLYSGLKALESQSNNKTKKGRVKSGDIEETPAPIVRVEKDTFVLADDVLVLLERAAMEPLPPKDDKGPQNRTKDGSSGEDFNKDSIERDERRLTELGRRTVEIFVLAHIFSNRIEVAYQEAVALKRQEELIREEEAAGQAENELRVKREKEKRSKKKQAKQKRNSRKGKDRGKAEKSDVTSLEKNEHGNSSTEKVLEAQPVIEKPDMTQDVSDVSDGGDVTEVLQEDFEDRDIDPSNWDTDTSEILPAIEASSSGTGSLPMQNGGGEKRSVMDDSSSTCSTDSVPSVVMNGPYKGNNGKANPKSSLSSRGKNQRNKSSRDHTTWVQDTDNQARDPASISINTRGEGPESEAVVLSLKDRIQRLEQSLVEKDEELVSLHRKLSDKDQVEVDRPSKPRIDSCSPGSPTGNVPSNSLLKKPTETVQVREVPSHNPSPTEKLVLPVAKSIKLSSSKIDIQKPAVLTKPSTASIEKAMPQQVPSVSRPSSAPLIPAPRPNAPVISMVQTTPLLARSVSAAGRLGADPVPTNNYMPQSYRNAIMGKTSGSSPATYVPHSSSSSLNPPLTSYSQASSTLAPSSLGLPSQHSTRKNDTSSRSGFTFGTVTPEILLQPQWMDETSQQEMNGMLGPHLLNDISGSDIYGSTSSGSGMCFSEEVQTRQAQDEFPHLDIINYLLDEEQNIGRAGKVNGVLQNSHSGHHQPPLSRQLTFPSDIGMADMGPSINCCRFDRAARYEDGTQRMYSASGSPYDSMMEVGPRIGMSVYANGQMDGMMQNQWAGNTTTDLSLLNMRNVDDGYPFQLPDYSSLACGLNGYSIFRPADGH
ncbi:TNF receptor-associated factor homolog 1b-like isoform X2 [Aristolochia californica]|uniref:TNF receptor-associated factor homolog 1b-like isoform X2 n=1 Tax=Aristolochia californica TaxID=171875 RepID=UPI0035D8B5DB